MNPDDKAQSLYYRTIARHFLARRGAPFFLSAKDLDLISAWQKAGIPLEVALEGIERAFDNFRLGQHRADKVLSLSFCNVQVGKALEQHRERTVGRGRKTAPRQDKRERARAEVERFLAHLPAEIIFLKETYDEARRALAEMEDPDDNLEKLEERAEKLLLAHAGESDRELLKRETRGEAKRAAAADWDRALDLMQIKRLRVKHKIPYLSLFYY